MAGALVQERGDRVLERAAARLGPRTAGAPRRIARYLLRKAVEPAAVLRLESTPKAHRDRLPVAAALDRQAGPYGVVRSPADEVGCRGRRRVGGLDRLAEDALESRATGAERASRSED